MSAYLSEVIHKFTPLSGSDIPVAEDTAGIVESLLANPSIVYKEVVGKGCILGIVYPHFLNPEVVICQELGWWVEPEFRNTSVGIKLYNAFEREAVTRGATKVMMISLEAQSPQRMDRLYKKLGFRMLEHTYIKEV